jgi:hypothetical protein
MKGSANVAVVFCCLVLTWAGNAPPVLGQPVLERLEQSIRQRLGETNAPAESTDAPAMEAPSEAAAERPGEEAGEKARAEPGYLGVVADDSKDRGRGVRILEVRPDGPADRAGLRKQDLITGVAGIRVRQMTDLADVLILVAAGDSVVFDVLRGAKQQKVKVTLGRRPPPDSTIRPEDVPLPPGEAAPMGPPPVGPRLQDPAAATPPAEAPTSIEQLQRRLEQLERRVAELERVLAEALNRQ